MNFFASIYVQLKIIFEIKEKKMIKVLGTFMVLFLASSSFAGNVKVICNGNDSASAGLNFTLERENEDKITITYPSGATGVITTTGLRVKPHGVLM